MHRLFVIFLYLLSLLPFRLLYLLADVFALILFYVAGYRKKVVFNNLRNAFPEKSEQEIHSIARKFYTHLSDLLVESIKMLSITKKDIDRRIKILNPELIDGYYSEGKSLLAVGTHYGNWEWGGLALSNMQKHKILGIYKPLSNKKADQLIKRMRSRFGTIPVPMNAALRKIVEYKDQLTITVLISDQTPAKNDVNHWVSFLNQQTPVFLGIEKLARQTGYPVIYCDMQKVKRGYFTIRLLPVSNEPGKTAEHELTEKHVRMLEEIIRKKPEYWLWSHRRWKHKPSSHPELAA